MKKINTVIGILMMLCALLSSEKIYILVIYAAAAVIHEIGHIAAALVLRIRIKDISFDYSGLRIDVDEDLRSYITEVFLAAAGPISNFLAATATAIFIKASGRELLSTFEAAGNFIETGCPNIDGISAFFIIASCVQAMINLLPVKTFDGGRILHCILAQMFDENKSDVILSITSGVFAFVLWTVSLYLMLRISSGLGIYIFSASIFSMTLINDKVFYKE